MTTIRATEKQNKERERDLERVREKEKEKRKRKKRYKKRMKKLLQSLQLESIQQNNKISVIIFKSSKMFKYPSLITSLSLT